MPIKVLIMGCSLSAGIPEQAGWLERNFHYHYSKILENTTRWHITNRALGGCSNAEIGLRTLENCLSDRYDFCIVQWSSLHRYWFYESENNIDNETQLLPRICGWGDHQSASMMSKIIVSKYLNDYMALKHWLLNQIFLQTFFNQTRTKYVFIRGFPNFIHDLENISQQGSFDCIFKLDLPSAIKEILHFDNNPDDYLFNKLLSLMTIYHSIDKSCCIGYNSNHDNLFGLPKDTYANDKADDGMHPGKLHNSFLATCILDYAKNKGLIS